VQMVAAQALTVEAPIRLIRGTAVSGAEDVLLDAGTDLALRAPITSIDGLDSLTISAGGRIDILAPLGLRVTSSASVGSLLIDAGGDVVVGTPIAHANGATAVQAAGLIDVRKPIRAGTSLTLDAQTGVTSVSPLRSPQRCGCLAIHGHGGSVILTKPITCNARFTPGPLTISSDVDVTVDAKIRANAEVDTGGSVSVTSTGGIVTLSGLVDTRGHVAGDVQVSGGTVQVDVRRVDTRPGGRQTYTATGGDLTLTGGSFVAQNVGTIEGTATGNLTASGSIQVGMSGCIALAAGGTLDTSGATFDAPVASSCP